jgi:hypothetical protein
MSLDTLIDIQNHFRFETDKGGDGAWHTYLKQYDELFLPFKTKRIKLLEFGICHAGSISLFSEYFKNGTIFGLDLYLSYINHYEAYLKNNVVIIHKDFSTVDENFMGDINFDIIIDDASHSFHDQKKVLDIFRHRLNPNGLLIIEDLSIRYKNFQFLQKYVNDIKLPNVNFINLSHESEKSFDDNILLVYTNKPQ